MRTPQGNVVLVTGNHLCHNPRVLKEASALASAGYLVEVLGAWTDAGLKLRDLELVKTLPFRFTPVLDLTKSEHLRQLCRVKGRLGHLCHRWLGLENHWQLGASSRALLAASVRRCAEKALFIAHSEAALWAVSRLSRPKLRKAPAFRIGVDMEDWFSEDLLPEARRNRPIRLLRRLEEGLLRKAAHSSCPSEMMSQALAAEYRCQQPTVVYNAFSWAERQMLDGEMKDRRNRKAVSLHWFSQTLGPGRGLEQLFLALPMVDGDLEVHLRGELAIGAREWLKRLIPPRWLPRVFHHSLVSNSELLSRIAEHDIGYAGELKYCRSKDLTISNKILQYLQAGLAVLASDTAGQVEVAKVAPGAVSVCSVEEPGQIADRLNRWLRWPGELKAAREAGSEAARNRFCWERVEIALVESVRRVFASS